MALFVLENEGNDINDEQIAYYKELFNSHSELLKKSEFFNENADPNTMYYICTDKRVDITNIENNIILMLGAERAEEYDGADGADERKDADIADGDVGASEHNGYDGEDEHKRDDLTVNNIIERLKGDYIITNFIL